MFLSRRDIEHRKNDLFPEIWQYEHTNLSEVSYDLRVGDEVFLSEKRVPERLSENSQYILLPPGQFALVKTFEKISIPKDLLALLSIRSTYKFQGLINISGFHVDPTYSGYLIFAVQNVGPNDIRLKYKDRVFMIMFAELKNVYDGNDRKKGYDEIQLDQMAKLGGPSVTLTQLQNRVENLSLSLKIYGGIAIAILVAVVALFFSHRQ